MDEFGRRSRGHWVELQPVRPTDYDFLYSLATSGESSARWRFGATTPSPEAFARSLWEGVVAQFVVRARSSARPLGLVSAYRPDMLAGHVGAAVLLDPAAQCTGWALESFSLLVDYLLDNWDLNKIYLEYPAFNRGQFFYAIRRGLVMEEATLRDHVFAFGRLWDFHIAAIYRERWERWRAARVPIAGKLQRANVVEGAHPAGIRSGIGQVQGA
jgi:RimJ/RimL family protein N-acetyltransferase